MDSVLWRLGNCSTLNVNVRTLMGLTANRGELGPLFFGELCVFTLGPEAPDIQAFLRLETDGN